MTNDRKICKRCRVQVRIFDPDRVRFICRKHGVLRWDEVTHGEPAKEQVKVQVK